MLTYAQVTESKQAPFTGNIRNYMTVDGYTKRSGAPTDWVIKVKGSNRWRRVYNFCNSNSGTLFISTKQSNFTVVNDYDLKS